MPGRQEEGHWAARRSGQGVDRGGEATVGTDQRTTAGFAGRILVLRLSALYPSARWPRAMRPNTVLVHAEQADTVIGVRDIWACGARRGEHPHIGPVQRPAPMPLPDQLPGAEFVRQISSRRPGTATPADPLQRLPVVVPRTPPASFARRKTRFDRRPQLSPDNTRAKHGSHRDRIAATGLAATPEAVARCAMLDPIGERPCRDALVFAPLPACLSTTTNTKTTE